MITVREIERAIEKLPSDQFAKIYEWIVEKDWREWDAQIARDSAAGKLDFWFWIGTHTEYDRLTSGQQSL